MLTNQLNFQVVTSIHEAKDLWEKFSPHRFIDDEWDFRYTFFKHLPYELFFVVGYRDGKIVGLLPLQKNTRHGLMPPYAPKHGQFLEFFGGDDTDDNTYMGNIAPSQVVRFINNLAIPTYLAPLNKTYKEYPDTKLYDNKYYLNLKNYNNHEDFLDEKWSSSSKKKILQQVRKIYREHTVEIKENQYEDINFLVEFNKSRFGETSSFSFDYRKTIFEELTKLYNVLTLSVIIDGQIEAISYGILYKGTYIGMNAGVRNSIPDVAKLMFFLQLDTAIEKGCKMYDVGKGESGWKEQFHLEKHPQYILSFDNKNTEVLLPHGPEKA